MIRKILVPVDGSAFAEAALPPALALSAKTGAEVRLAMANEPANLPPGLWAEAFLANHAKYLDGITARVTEQAPDTEVSSVLLDGEVADALCSEIEASRADLVVMSTHGHGGLTRVWLGSVADAVLRESPAPVLLVRPGEDESGDPVAASTFTHVVVPLDGTTFAEAALDPALEYAQLFGASLTMIRAVSYPVMISSYLPDTVEENEAFIRQAEEDAEAYLAQLAAAYSHGETSIGTEVVVSSRPAAGVLEHVAKSGGDLVVMASHNRHGFKRAVLGSVADKVVRGAHTPVLVVHPTPMDLPLRSEEVA